MFNITTEISNLIENQFPAFYKEEGPYFIEFVKTYYEWLEQENNIVDVSRSLQTLNDIDLTKDQYLKHFQKKYMADIPDTVFGDVRFLQKHILDLYRSKGSDAGIKLLFKLLYNEDIEIYIPGDDILKPSDNRWVRRKFLEITYTDKINLYQDKLIIGVDSNTHAFVETYESIVVDGVTVHLLYVSYLDGEFNRGERIICDGITIPEASIILGSPYTIEILNSSRDMDIGEVLYDKNVRKDHALKVAVETTRTSIGTIRFDLVDGGSGYSNLASVSITTGSNTTGAGANFVLGEFDYEGTLYDFSVDVINDYANVLLSANNYGFTSYPTANVNTLLYDALNIIDIEYGTIRSIITTNPGGAYDGNVNVSVFDRYVSSVNMIDPFRNNSIKGTNAVVTGTAQVGASLANSLRIIQSGKNYEEGQQIKLNNEANTKFVDIKIHLTNYGIEEGYYQSTNSFLSDKKYLQDNYYYQEHSYEIRASRTLSKYFQILKKLVHPAGNMVFGASQQISKETLINTDTTIITTS